MKKYEDNFNKIFCLDFIIIFILFIFMLCVGLKLTIIENKIDEIRCELGIYDKHQCEICVEYNE